MQDRYTAEIGLDGLRKAKSIQIELLIKCLWVPAPNLQRLGEEVIGSRNKVVPRTGRKGRVGGGRIGKWEQTPPRKRK